VQVHLTQVDIVVVGSAGRAWQGLLDDYERRIGRYVRLEVRELKGAPLRDGPAAVLAAEASRVHAALDRLAGGLAAPGNRPEAHQMLVVACDSHGEALASEPLAERLLAPGRLLLLVGGACGLAPDVLERCHLHLAFGQATLPHQLARLVLTEQLYRAFRIARGEPYHH